MAGLKCPVSSGRLNFQQVTILAKKGFQELDPTDSASLAKHLAQGVDVTRLNDIQQYLWLAGLPRPARSLFHQVTLGREIAITGDADPHFIWHQTRVLIKPLPEFLMCQSIWMTHLCKDRPLYESAAGLLLSYMWLVGLGTDQLKSNQAF
jgi:hypothetical protein